MTPATVRKHMRAAAKERGSQKLFAAECGVTLAHMNDMINGRREISERVLDVLGLERAPVSYRKKDTTE